MKKISLILIGICCFIFALLAQRSIDNYFEQKSKAEFIQQLENKLPQLSPTEVFKHYWQFASENKLDEISALVTFEPASYWIKCVGDHPPESFFELDNSQHIDEEFSGALYNFRFEISMMRANRPKLKDLRIIDEQIFEDEARVDFVYLNTNNRAFFKKESGVWKLFSINNMSLDFMKVDYYAKPRLNCEIIKEIHSSGDAVIVPNFSISLEK